MMPHSFVLLSRLFAVILACAGATRAGDLRVMTFNIRYANTADAENGWDQRADFVFDTITGFKPALIGFQEVVARQHDAIVARMPDYAFCGVAREDGKRRGEWTLVGFRKDRFTAITKWRFLAVGTTRRDRQ